MVLSIQGYNAYAGYVPNFRANEYGQISTAKSLSQESAQDKSKNKALGLTLMSLGLLGISLFLMKGKGSKAVESVVHGSEKATSKAANAAKNSTQKCPTDDEIDKAFEGFMEEFRREQAIRRKRFDNIAAKMPDKAGTVNRPNGITIETRDVGNRLMHIVKDKNGVVRQKIRTHAGNELASIRFYDRQGDATYKYIAM